MGLTIKLTLILAMLVSAPLLLLMENQSRHLTAKRISLQQELCEQVATATVKELQQKNYAAIQSWLDMAKSQSEDVISFSLVRHDGLVVCRTDRSGTDGLASETGSAEQGAVRRLTIPIVSGTRIWGNLEAELVDVQPKQYWFSALPLLGLALFFNVAVIGWVLRRTLLVIDGSKAIPQRVKNALETIASGVLIVDPKGRILVANSAFESSTGKTMSALVGKPISSIPFTAEQDEMPWALATHTLQRQSGVMMRLESQGNPDSQYRSFVVNATPILDDASGLSGVMIGFEDVTNLERQKQSLMKVLSELQKSREKIHLQNLHLQELASKDALTGCFNRRMLFERLEANWRRYQDKGIASSVIMLDVDHFKKLNDNHGHAVGDEVLKSVARIIRGSVGDLGFVGRYGGEEFCVALSNQEPQQAEEIAEGIRRAIEHQLREPYGVTSSFGVSSGSFGAQSFSAMLEQADQALYSAKQSGRNRVCLWSEVIAAEEKPKETVLPSQTALSSKQDLSYQAVASLHSALAYRDPDTALHSQRVSHLCVAIGRGLMPLEQLYILELAALLHDIGKIGVPDSVLLKPGKLDQQEWAVMESHARIGVEIVDSAFSCPALTDIIRYHHYRFDGAKSPSGSPVGKDIPLGARIVSLADAYDAMVSNRVYRPGRSPEEAFAELRRCAGGQFDPDLVERFISLQIGWRPDSRYALMEIETHQALEVGHLTERIISAFTDRDARTLAEALERIKQVARSLDQRAIVGLADELSKAIAHRDIDWESLAAILGDLLDICLTIQRAHICSVGGRPEVTDDFPHRDYYQKAREWELAATANT